MRLSAVERLLATQDGLGKTGEGKQMGERVHVRMAAARRERERMEALVVVPPLQGVAAVAVEILAR